MLSHLKKKIQTQDEKKEINKINL